MHDASHEDLAVLLHAGEAPAGTDALLAGCPDCVLLLEDLRLGSRLAARAAAAPPARLQAMVLAGLEGGRAPRNGLKRALALAAACAVAVVLARWDSGAGRRPEDLDADLARVQSELDALSEDVSRGHELADFDADIDDLRGDAANLRRQLGG